MSGIKYESLIEKMIELEDDMEKVIQQLKALEEKSNIPYFQLASLCKWEYCKEVFAVYKRWKQRGLKYMPSENPDSQSGKLLFNPACDNSMIYKDLALLINRGAFNCSINKIASVIVGSTNLGESQESVRKRLLRCKKNFK